MKRAKSHHQTTSESFIEMLFNFFPEGAVVTDEYETIIEANPEFRRMFNCGSENISGKKVNDVVARRPACGKTARAVSETLAKTGRIYLETERSGRDGRPFPVAIHVVRIEPPRGRPVYLGVYRDISGYKEITRSFVESEFRFREMYESAPFGLYRTTPDGGKRFPNSDRPRKEFFTLYPGCWKCATRTHRGARSAPQCWQWP